jgi:hypothetical protein
VTVHWGACGAAGVVGERRAIPRVCACAHACVQVLDDDDNDDERGGSTRGTMFEYR